MLRLIYLILKKYMCFDYLFGLNFSLHKNSNGKVKISVRAILRSFLKQILSNLIDCVSYCTCILVFFSKTSILIKLKIKNMKKYREPSTTKIFRLKVIIYSYK